MEKPWSFLQTARDQDIPLLWASLLIAKDEYPDLDIAGYQALCASYCGAIRKDLPETLAPEEALRRINRFLFEDQGFAGNDQDYYDPRNSYLNDVLERKLGIPISLAVIQLEVAQRLGLPLEGVSFPGHFLVRLPVAEGIVVLDPFHKGRSLDEHELKQRAKPHLNGTHIDDRVLGEMLEPASRRSILTRMLRNLKSVYVEREQWDRALRCTDRLLTLDATLTDEYRDRGVCYLKLEHRAAARADLSRYLVFAPQSDDADSVRHMLIEASGSDPRIN